MDNPDSPPASSFSLVLPPSSAVNSFWPESQQLVALPHDLQRAISSHHGAIHIGFCLLLALVDTIHPQSKALSTLVTLEHYLPWIVDSVQGLWRHYRRWTISSERRAIYDEIMLVYMQLLESLLTSSVTPRDRAPASSKIAQALTSSLIELLHSSSATQTSEVVQIRIASIFTRLRSILGYQSIDNSIPRRRQDSTRHVIQNEVEHAVNRLFQDEECFVKLHKDLQVRNPHLVRSLTDEIKLALCLWTSPDMKSMQVANLRKELCENEFGSFSDAQLSEESMSAVKAFRALNLGDGDRPAKRRKKLPESSEDVNQDALRRIMMSLNGSIHDSPVLFLSNAQDLIQ